jgi:uncharacterized peroxidase-related enzyme
MNWNKSVVVMSVVSVSLCVNAREPHIAVPEGIPGIRALFAFCPETAKPLRELAELLLRKDSPALSSWGRELIGAYVSSLNECNFCCRSHSAAATYLLGGDTTIVTAVLNDMATAPISDTMKALLTIAGKVQKSGLLVTPEDITHARKHGATDQDIHDTVLIAAAFCLYNRYVDGLASPTPTDQSVYDAAGERIGEHGYIRN